MHLTVHDGKLYVAEYLNDRIQILTLTGQSLGIVAASGAGPGEFDAPGGVAVDSAGRLYVADFYNQRVQVLSPEGRFLRQHGTTGQTGVGAGRFNYPTDVDLLPDGSLVVADAYNDRIQVFSPAGEFLRKWGGPFATNLAGSAHGWFKTVTGVGVEPKNARVFVADFYNHRVQKFTSEGTFLTSFGSQGTEPGRFDRPTDVAVDREGNVFVVDFGNNRIQKFALGSEVPP